jgi:quercetin dioxygenase-like cupin family protein
MTTTFDPDVAPIFERIDPYEEWQKDEDVQKHAGLYVKDLFSLELSDWPRMGCKGAVVYLDGDEETNEIVLEIGPGGNTNPVRHMYNEVVYVLEGRGATAVWYDESHKQTFEWKDGAYFSIPMNAWYQHFNGSGTDSTRMVSVTNMPGMMRKFITPDFIWNNPYVFTDRLTNDEGWASASGQMYKGRVWETNFLPDAANMPMPNWGERGAGGTNIMLSLSDNTVSSHISEFPVGTYKKAHRHGPGAHLLITGGEGFALLWREEDMSDLVMAPWQKGSLYLPTQDAENEYFHQHFNVGTTPARYINMAPSNSRKYTYKRGINDPSRMAEIRAMVSIKEGGIQLEYEDEPRRIHEIFEAELAKHGQVCRMKNLVPWCTGVAGPENRKGHLGIHSQSD